MTWWQWVLIAGGGWLAASFLGGVLIGQFIEAGKGPRRRRAARPGPVLRRVGAAARPVPDDTAPAGGAS